MPGRREQVRESAQYLRRVRPLDPGELAEYVDGGAHPGVVREDLRALAPELGLVERADGAFVPVGDDPVEPGEVAATPVEALPGERVRAVEDLLVDEYGPGWPEGETGAALRETIRAFKRDYYRQNPVAYDREVALAYAVYHLPAYYATLRYVASDLARDRLLGRHLRVLDVGAGVGGPALGLADALPADALVEYHAVEPSAAADVAERLLGDAGRNVHATVHRETAEAHDPDGAFDLVLFSNVLSELDDPVAVAADYLDAVARDGTMALVAPADRETAIGLRRVERALVDERGLASVYAPTVRFWPGERPTDRGWSFVRQPPIDPPAVQTRLADGESEFRRERVQYAYAYLRPDGRERFDVALDRGEVAAMADSREHVTSRVDLVAAKLSPDLADANTNPLFKVSDGSEAVDHYAVLVNRTELNAALEQVPYGTPLRFENALVLWNDDEAAINLVVDEEAVVEPA